MNPILLDVLAAAVLLFFLWRGYQKGFVFTLCGFLAVFVAFIGSNVLASALAEPVARMVEPAIESRIYAVLAEAIRHTHIPSISGGIALLPEDLPLAAVVEQLNGSKLFRGLAGTFLSAVESGAANVTTNAARSLAHYAAVQLSRTVVFSLSFFVVVTGWKIFSRTLKRMAKLPVLSTLNRWAGGAVGLLMGTALVLIVTWVLRSSFIPPAMVEQTYLLRLLYGLNPL